MVDPIRRINSYHPPIESSERLVDICHHHSSSSVSVPYLSVCHRQLFRRALPFLSRIYLGRCTYYYYYHPSHQMAPSRVGVALQMGDDIAISNTRHLSHRTDASASSATVTRSFGHPQERPCLLDRSRILKVYL